PFFSTALYARSVGFLRRNRVEVGERVHGGQLLAEIDAPENDEEVRLARAQLEEAAQNVSLGQRSAERSQRLSDVGLVSKDAADQLRAQANSAEASLKTRRAAFQRVSTLRGYQRVLAPFDGVITRRNFDPGALVGVAGQGGMPLFELAQTGTLRVYVDVPQSLAAGVVPGIEAMVYAPATPGDAVPGKVIRTNA